MATAKVGECMPPSGAAIGRRITSLGLGPRLVMLSGDAHMLAFDDGRNNVNGGFVVAQSGPLDRFVRLKGGPYSHEPPSQRNGQFATLDVKDTGTVLTATLQGYRHLGSGRSMPVPETRLELRCQGGRCEPQPSRPESGASRPIAGVGS